MERGGKPKTDQPRWKERREAIVARAAHKYVN